MGLAIGVKDFLLGSPLVVSSVRQPGAEFDQQRVAAKGGFYAAGNSAVVFWVRLTDQPANRKRYRQDILYVWLGWLLIMLIIEW